MQPHKTEWFNESKLCMFVHYGLYAQIRRGEWTQFNERKPCEEVAELANTFDPRYFDAEDLVQRAKEAGFKYVCLTSRHHEGFCLFDSKVSDFTSMKYVGRDLIAEYVAACRKYDMKVGIYYSLLDWRFKGYFDHRKYPESKEKMVQQAHDQVRELLTNYGKIDYLWFDGGWYDDVLPGSCPDYGEKLSKFWRSRELLDMIYTLQPHIIINDRTGEPGDVTTPEQKVGAIMDDRYVEACMTLGDRWGWGHIQNNHLKDFRTVLQTIVLELSMGGNFNLNVGPMEDGTIPAAEQRILAQLGKWLRTNGEAVYGTGKMPDGIESIIGEFTTKGNNIYWHIFRWPHKGEAILRGLRKKVVKVTCLENGREYPFRQEAYGRLIVEGLPLLAPDVNATVLKIECTDEDTPADPDTYGVF